MKMTRATGAASLVIVSALLALIAPHDLRGNMPPYPERDRFAVWLSNLEHRGDEADGLYPYFRSDEPDFPGSADDFLSPMVSAKCALFWLEEGDVTRALRTAKALRSWQNRDADSRHANARGALPSQIARTGVGWTAGDRFYSGDNLVVLAAFLAVYERTRDEDYLKGAREIADWLVNVMCQGVRWGVWKDDHGAPMQFVTRSGAFNNQIFANVELLWLNALMRCGEVVSAPEYIAQYHKARAFLLSGQASWGPWYDHYDPGYPPVPYSASRWVWYGGNRPVIVADNTMRAALGALRMGDRDAARKFASWLRTHRGAVPAYLNAETGAGHFDVPDAPYYDVVVSGMWSVLCDELGDESRAAQARVFLAFVQNTRGAWYWGLRMEGLRPVQRSEAILTGYWAVTADRGAPRR